MRIARQRGKEIELNDDNQTVDKQELMAAGLNISGANERKLGQSTLGKPKDGQMETVQSHRAVGTAASRGEISKRRAREIQIQMEKEQVHLALEKRRAEEEARKCVIARRNTESDVQSTRGYLARKQQKTGTLRKHQHRALVDSSLIWSSVDVLNILM